MGFGRVGCFADFLFDFEIIQKEKLMLNFVKI